ncbi:Rib/alpha-like domain-containing protein [Corynebacterium jeikeium]|uniref:Rib/alpha-like domain-containing protein n=1 Tax=Corynebacterium jeikeium TaxID=38289 RepID=UPI0011AE55D7|nr:Rib/alpha-like domain-containing protein [Corynebacterium jeikeium]
MKSIAAAGAVLALATTGTVVVQTQTAPTAVAEQDESGNEGTTAGSDKAIYSPGKASQEGTISGSVKEIVEATVPFENVQKSGNPLEGVRIYAQWYEGENTQHSSPVYYTESDANGNFTIKMAPYTDALGVTREFRADASVGTPNGGDWSRDENREKIRVWTVLPEDMTDKYRLVHQPAAGIFPLTTTTPTTQGDGKWGDGKITGMTIQYAQKDKLPQHLPENKWGESTGTNLSGAYKGQAFWNLDVLQGATNHNQASAFDPKDIPAPGLKVVGSYLTDEAVTKIEEYAKANFAGKELRGKGWTPTDEAGLQKWINEQVAADPEGWIAETLTTTTGADGRFQLLWKGLYGNNHTGTGGGINPPADKLHKLAGSHDEGSWNNGNLESKHVNMDWSYVSVLDKDGNPLPDNIGTLYPWALGNWAGPTSGGANAQLFGGDLSYIGNTTDVYTGWNIALAPQALKFDVVDKNTTDNWANLGDKVQTDTAGLPISDNLNYYIEWVDKDGKVVKTCETAKADTATKIPSCELEVPTDAQTGDTFTARLKVTPNNPDPKNDLVLAMDAFAVARDYLAYDPVDAKRGEEATSEPKFDNPATEPEEKKPEKAKFELGELPEGVTEDQVKVDPKTGVVTFTPKDDQAAKAYNFPVIMRNEDLKVPVLDENGAPVKDESGKPKTQGRIVARANATFKLADAPKLTAVDDSGVKPVDPTDEKQDTGVDIVNKDDDTKVSATDEDGKKVPVEVDEDGNVHVTPGTDVDGPITVVVEDPDLPGGKVEVEVPVTDHEKDRDDNGSEKTKVEGDPKPVDPTDEKQDTGVDIVNKDDDTKVSATDEDGKKVPVEVDEDGNVHVTPGTDVDGPITVVVEDPDLPGGKVEVEVPVTDHEKDRDDNGSEKTKVEGDPKPVDPTDEKQDTGVDIVNKDDDTKVSATDEDGKKVPVEVDEDGNVHVTPGTDVDGPITVVVEDPDLPGGKVEVEVPVTDHEKDRDDNGSEKTKVEGDPKPVDRA